MVRIGVRDQILIVVEDFLEVLGVMRLGTLVEVILALVQSVDLLGFEVAYVFHGNALLLLVVALDVLRD